MDDGTRWCVGISCSSSSRRIRPDPCAQTMNRGPSLQSTHCGTALRSDSDAHCGEPECLVQSVQPVDCTQKGPETRAAKYGVRTFAVRAATLSVRSQIERFGKPVTVSRWQVKGPIVIRCKIGNDKRTTKLLFRLGTCLQTRFPPLRVCSFGNHALLPPPAARSSGRPPDGS